MSFIEADTGRLRRESEALGSQASWLRQAKSELDGATSSAAAGCHGGLDGGLSGALSKLRSAWDYEIDSLSKDVSTASEVVTTIANLYDQLDAESAASLQP